MSKIEFKLKPFNRNLNELELLDDIKKVAIVLKKGTITSREYNKYGRWNSSTPVRHFGSWNKALKKTGLKVKNRLNISMEELFDNLKEVWIKLGRQPTCRDIISSYSAVSLTVYTKRFGTWRNALEKFVKFVNEENLTNNLEFKSKKIIKRSNRNPNLRLIFVVMRRDNFKCVHCGKSPATHLNVTLHIDHIKPWSKGGDTTLENLQTLCSNCNQGKSDLE
jgi:hypothetical protein